MTNKVILIGRVGNDPEMRNAQDGKSIANFSLATSEKYKDKSGQRQEKTDGHRCAAFGRLAEIIGQYVKKGAHLYVEGRITYRKWQDRDGVEKYATDIIVHDMQMLGGKEQASNQKQDGDFNDDIPW